MWPSGKILTGANGCSLHSQALVDCYATGIWSNGLSIQIFCSASFARKGHHFVRLIKSVPPFVRGHVGSHIGGPNDYINLQELGSFALDNCAMFERHAIITSAPMFKNKDAQPDSSIREIEINWGQFVGCVMVCVDGWFFPTFGADSLYSIGFLRG